jgi:hypothetical protein
MAVGVASPRAQGQATINTAMKTVRAKMKVAPAMKYHTNAETVAVIIMAGTK